MAFTEYWILMLSSVLKNEQAIQINIKIIEIFISMRKLLITNENLYEKIQHLENNLWDNSLQIQELWFEWEKMIRCDEIDNGEKIWFKVDN